MPVPLLSRLAVAVKAARELGVDAIAHYTRYQIYLRTGQVRRLTPIRPVPSPTQLPALPDPPPGIFPLPSSEALRGILGKGIDQLTAEADEIAAGRMVLFGHLSAPLDDFPPAPHVHWSAAAVPPGTPHDDVKFLWEPARLGWVYTLGRAYLATGQGRYAAAFWTLLETFLRANPPNQGVNWASGQEVALRIMALVFGWQVFAGAPESGPQRLALLKWAVITHAARIPPTLDYAISQKNNHLLTEAAGLFTAGSFMPRLPAAYGWRETGWNWLNRALQNQIAADGCYAQHSANYHRLMLQTALWAGRIAGAQGLHFPVETRRALSRATEWLYTLFDAASGRVANLGSNDGAYILPLSGCPFDDYRPILQAAGLAFCEIRYLLPGAWDEMTLWLSPGAAPEALPNNHPAIEPANAPLRLERGDSWAYLRAARFTGRPSHADQLHLDLWWRGLNVALDAGTYLYNAAPPWDNALAGTAVHNTVSVDGRDQMTRAGRFLWLDWAQARVIACDRDIHGRLTAVTASHDGYRDLGVVHQRQVDCCQPGSWIVQDDLLSARSEVQPHTCRLHWLLPDWEWKIDGLVIKIHSPHGWVALNFAVDAPRGDVPTVQLVRAGELVYGQGEASSILGWHSAAYGLKSPALSLSLSVTSILPVTVTTTWQFPARV